MSYQLAWLGVAGEGVAIEAGPTRSPGAGASVTAPGGSISWTNPGNILTSNNVRSTAANNADPSTALTHYLRATQFGFEAGDLPALARLEYMLVEIERSKSFTGDETNYAADHDVRLVKRGTVQSENAAEGFQLAATDVYGEFVLSLDGWTIADLCDATSGVVYASELAVDGSGPSTMRVDHIRVTPYYVVPLTTELLPSPARFKPRQMVHGVIRQLRRSGG